jgi:hypothetical protein
MRCPDVLAGDVTAAGMRLESDDSRTVVPPRF